MNTALARGWTSVCMSAGPESVEFVVVNKVSTSGAGWRLR